MSKKFVLVSLQEKKAKRIAEVISNNTCRKMLDFMASKKDVTESELSKELKIPISTVHYNMKALIDAKLVKSDEYHYSEKGKEVSHYRLANQYVIIAPEEEKESLREKLKSILPITLVAGFGASVVRALYGFYYSAQDVSFGLMKAAPMPAPMEAVAGAAQDADVVESMAQPMLKAADESARAAYSAVQEEAVATVAESAPSLTQNAEVWHAPEPSFWSYVSSHIPQLLFWFFIGLVLALGLYFLVRFIKRKRLHRKIRVKPGPRR